jgi:hypothetical protein
MDTEKLQKGGFSNIAVVSYQYFVGPVLCPVIGKSIGVSEVKVCNTIHDTPILS